MSEVEQPAAFRHWNAIDGAINELDLIRVQLVEARQQSRTIRFYEILLAHPNPSQRACAGEAIELSEGWCIVHWAQAVRRSVDFYQSIDRLRAAMAVNGGFILSLTDLSERDLAFAPRASQTRGQLTDRELSAISHLGHGLSNRDIGRAIGLTESTVKSLLSGAYKKMGVSDRTQAALLARDLDLAS
jgi:DNA-binding CsgD family transcriptional regulator